MPDRIYNEEEITTLLKRAAQIQHEQPGDEVAGLNRAELERLAAEVGIDQRALSQALREMRDGQASEKQQGFYLGGGPRRHTITRMLDVPLTDDVWAQIVGQLRREYNDTGIATQLGRTREWHLKKGIQVDVSATEVKGRTRLTISQKNDDVIGGVYGGFYSSGLTFALVTALVATEIPGLARISIALLILTATVLGAWFTSRIAIRRRGDKMEALVDRLDLALRREAAPLPQTESDALPDSPPALSLDDLPEAPETASLQEARRTRS